MTSLATERAAALARRAKIEEPNKIRGRARNLLQLRWNATTAELEEAIAEKYPKMTADERETVLAQTLEVQRKERPTIDPATRNVRYQPDPENEPKPRKKEAPFGAAVVIQPLRPKKKKRPKPETREDAPPVANEDLPVIHEKGEKMTAPLTGPAGPNISDLRTLLDAERVRVFDAARKLFGGEELPPLELIRTAVGREAGQHLTLSQARYVRDQIAEELRESPDPEGRLYDPPNVADREAIIALGVRMYREDPRFKERAFVDAVREELGIRFVKQQSTYLRFNVIPRKALEGTVPTAAKAAEPAAEDSKTIPAAPEPTPEVPVSAPHTREENRKVAETDGSAVGGDKRSGAHACHRRPRTARAQRVPPRNAVDRAASRRNLPTTRQRRVPGPRRSGAGNGVPGYGDRVEGRGADGGGRADMNPKLRSLLVDIRGFLRAVVSLLETLPKHIRTGQLAIRIGQFMARIDAALKVES